MNHSYTLRRTLSTILFFLTSTLTCLSWDFDFESGILCYNITSETSVEVVSRGYWGCYAGNIFIPPTVTYEDKTYSVKSIGDGAFYGCPDITSMEISSSVTHIGNYAFASCYSLAYVNIPESVTNIGYSILESCHALMSITVSHNNPVYDSREGCNAIIETATNTLIAGCTSTTIPESVTSIGVDAFSCSDLTSINIPGSVTSIGDEAFWCCLSLTSVNIPGSVMHIGNKAFGACHSVTSIVVGDGVTRIGDSAFWNCQSVDSIIIGNSVKSIGDYAFCTPIDEPSSLAVVICRAKNVPELGSAVFANVQDEAILYVPASALEAYKTADQWKNFGTILPIDDGTTNVSTVPQDKEVLYYTLDGKAKTTPDCKGIYIKDGKKVMLR
ncbi:MAG: leucine-rich repeat domain-containing protein [Prevotellaceae bacterium]|nr:leucine-rich repeat domain-containing protein [Prevotellaceae bacterium]